MLVLLVGITPTYAGPPGGRIEISGRRGFDKCGAFNIQQMSDLATYSPFWTAGVYIGGLNAGICASGISYSWFSQSSYIGWGFIPIYAGLYAPCYYDPNNTHYKISTNVNSALNQAINDAHDAEAVANSLGFARGTEIYLDEEAYNTSDSTCRSLVNTYVNKWIQTLRADGYRAGAYGSSLGSAVNDWAAIASPPDDIYFAEWNDQANVSSQYINSGYWIYNQRHHQYHRDFILPSTGYGTVSGKNVNLDCSQGHVAGNGYDDGVPNQCP
jgi:hypothetical protein